MLNRLKEKVTNGRTQQDEECVHEEYLHDNNRDGEREEREEREERNMPITFQKKNSISNTGHKSKIIKLNNLEELNITESKAKLNSKVEIKMRTKMKTDEMVKSPFHGIEFRKPEEKGRYKYPELINSDPLSWLFEEI